MIFHNKADSIEANCHLASINHFSIYDVATENFQSAHVCLC